MEYYRKRFCVNFYNEFKNKVKFKFNLVFFEVTKNLKKCKSLIVCFFAIYMIIPSFAYDQNENEELSRDNKFSSLQKSLILPGWGQLTEKRYFEGALFLSAEIFCLYGVFSNNHKARGYYKKYKEANSVEDAVKFRDFTEKYDIRRNKFILAAVAVWAVNLIDIYVIVRNKKKKQQKLKIKLESGENKKLAFTISYSF